MKIVSLLLIICNIAVANEVEQELSLYSLETGATLTTIGAIVNRSANSYIQRQPRIQPAAEVGQIVVRQFDTTPESAIIVDSDVDGQAVARFGTRGEAISDIYANVITDQTLLKELKEIEAKLADIHKPENLNASGRPKNDELRNAAKVLEARKEAIVKVAEQRKLISRSRIIDFWTSTKYFEGPNRTQNGVRFALENYRRELLANNQYVVSLEREINGGKLRSVIRTLPKTATIEVNKNTDFPRAKRVQRLGARIFKLGLVPAAFGIGGAFATDASLDEVTSHAVETIDSTGEFVADKAARTYEIIEEAAQ
jgi:hypothetical protein